MVDPVSWLDHNSYPLPWPIDGREAKGTACPWRAYRQAFSASPITHTGAAAGSHARHSTGALHPRHWSEVGNGSPSRNVQGFCSSTATGIELGQSQQPLLELPTAQSASVW